MKRFNQARILFARVTDTRWLLGLAIAAGLAITTPVQAEDTPQPKATPPVQATPEQSKQMQEIQVEQAEYMKLLNRLKQIQQDTLKAHPEFEKQGQDLKAAEKKLNDDFMNAMKEKDPQVVQLMQQLQQKQQEMMQQHMMMKDSGHMQ